MIQSYLINDSVKKFHSITSFTSVKIDHNHCLLIFDIDETILQYPLITEQWWKETFEYYYSQHKDYDLADQQCTEDWKAHIISELPSHTDREGFFHLLQKAKAFNCKIIFVTARDPSLEAVTYDHLDHVGIDYSSGSSRSGNSDSPGDRIDVYFASDCNKAHIIDSVIKEYRDNNQDNKGYDSSESSYRSSIIFIDDREYNLIDVKDYFGDKVTCYKFLIQPE